MAATAAAAAGGPLLALASLFLALALATLPAAAQRFIIVGNDQDPSEPWSNLAVNYTDWTINNPLYVGDVCVFKYRFYNHVVWKLTSLHNWYKCIYNGADLSGNVTAGAGAGFWVEVTAEPQYIVCGINGHCAEDQKVILNGSLGPLPKKYKNLPVPATIYPHGRAPPPGTPSGFAPTFTNETGAIPDPPAPPPPSSSSPPTGSTPTSSPPPSSASLFQASLSFAACAAVSTIAML
eukprot:SM000129S26137  [mRNA]  locus=s129:209897:211061:+ [translate_table: standard]